ncbi:MAG: hypothetical protein ACRCZO_01250 [Cetobacterium sp.]
MFTCYIVPGKANITIFFSDYLTLNRKLDEVIRELRQLREIIMQQQQQQEVEEQANIEQMQTEEQLSAFCVKLTQESQFRKSMVIVLLFKNLKINI